MTEEKAIRLCLKHHDPSGFEFLVRLAAQRVRCRGRGSGIVCRGSRNWTVSIPGSTVSCATAASISSPANECVIAIGRNNSRQHAKANRLRSPVRGRLSVPKPCATNTNSLGKLPTTSKPFQCWNPATMSRTGSGRTPATEWLTTAESGLSSWDTDCSSAMAPSSFLPPMNQPFRDSPSPRFC